MIREESTELQKDVLNKCKIHIKEELVKGDVFTTSNIQRKFKTGYFLASKVINLLKKDGVIWFDENRLNYPTVV